jgi:hypothetical protein
MPEQQDMLVEACACAWLLMGGQLARPLRKAGKLLVRTFQDQVKISRSERSIFLNNRARK